MPPCLRCPYRPCRRVLITSSGACSPEMATGPKGSTLSWSSRDIEHATFPVLHAPHRRGLVRTHHVSRGVELPRLGAAAHGHEHGRRAHCPALDSPLAAPRPLSAAPHRE